MNRFALPVLALALASSGRLLATETARALHNDLDGDGRSDLVWRSSASGAVVYWSGADATRATVVHVAHANDLPGDFLAHATIALTFSDFSGTKAALLAQDSAGNLATAYFDYGRNAYATYWDSSVPAGYRLVGKYSGGYDDTNLVYRSPLDGRNLLSYLDWDHRAYLPLTRVTNLAWDIVGIGDFDDDGVSDLLWRNTTTGRNVIWRQAKALQPLAVATVPDLAWTVAAIGDFDGDGRSDIFWRNGRTGANVIWKAGDARTPLAVAAVPNLAWRVAATGDFNGDGLYDVVWRNASFGTNVLWNSADAATARRLPAVSLTWSPLM